ncbi:hypothetical protein DFA_05437 [Cavenderia fasciculata]|uniref:Uncharacterized protein n=1 Tax=Cavenderia fasciculata TaxID=261658 RepID=F4PL83_CACFS|nr:uncharacterized protein DFA_05437 [Cavenderia fasciculata]EGG23305.1 hypothetical protein DFA_05437 [Cavenderia fasciculata]|eukprot:XP_004361156.1 hypothetical protein DFA_05437 [Cavenderia fasciculata]
MEEAWEEKISHLKKIHLNLHRRDDNNERISTVDLTVSPKAIVHQPDRSYVPRGRANPVQPPLLAADQDNAPFPTMVVEIGVTQSLQSLHDKAIDYLCATTDIQIVLCISLWPRRRRGIINTNLFQMVALLYNRVYSVNHPQTVISFGTAPLHPLSIESIQRWGSPNQVQGHIKVDTVPVQTNDIYTIKIPSESLFNGVPGGVPTGVPANIPLNLLDLRDQLTDIQF